MANQPPANNEGDPSNKLPEGTTPADVGELAKHDSANEQHKPKAKNQIVKRAGDFGSRIRKLIAEYWDSLKNPEASNRVIAIATVVISVATVFTYLEAHSGSSQTDKVIAADERMAKAMEETVGQGKKALEATITQNQLDQRAWVAVRGTRIVTLAAGKPIQIDLDLFNAGKTFAVDTIYTGTIVSHYGPLDIAQYAQSSGRPQARSSPSVAILVPSINATASGYTDQALNEATVEAIKNGAEYLYIFGEVNYKDVFRQQHFTRFCNWYVPIEKAFHQCNQYNDAD